MPRVTPEKKVQDAIIKYLNDNGIYYERRSTSMPNYKKGSPDLFVVFSYLHIEVEVKKPGGTPSPLQLNFEQTCKQRGTPYIRCESFEEFLNKLESILSHFLAP